MMEGPNQQNFKEGFEKPEKKLRPTDGPEKDLSAREKVEQAEAYVAEMFRGMTGPEDVATHVAKNPYFEGPATERA